ncbi:MAG: site-specific integrase [Cyanobacteria bacterium P01_H01_bin.162]
MSNHSFRRSFATNLYRNGEPMAKICRLLGHKNLTMTARYIG